MITTALFPIPGCVAFPGTTLPLHVFEPRYRNMVNHCVNEGLPLAVAHTQKTISNAPADQSAEQALQSNQATYKPCVIFSAGPCEIIRTLDDGRMMIEIDMQHRLRLVHEIQTLPFTIANCQEITDLPMTDTEHSTAELYQQKIINRLKTIILQTPEAASEFDEAHWLSMAPEDFSFKIFNLLQLPPEYAQPLLETQQPGLRLQQTLDILNDSQS